MNVVCLIGNLSKTPELKYTSSNLAVCQFSLAVNRDMAKDGQQNVDYIQCTCWRKTAENLCKYTQKGNKIAVEGSIQTRNYEDSNGQKRYITEVLANKIKFLSSPNKQQSANPFDNQDYFDSGSQSDYSDSFKTTIDIDEEDLLPF